MTLRGSFYEEKAVEFLKLIGYRTLKRNFRSRFGEIDIIAKDKGYTVFIEVKARSGNYLVSGKEAVTAVKIEKLKKAALYYASKDLNRLFRFDVLEIIQGNSWRKYNLIKAAFDYSTDE
jgi:putative endonuclease